MRKATETDTTTTHTTCTVYPYALLFFRERERKREREKREKKAMNDCAKNGRLEETKLVVPGGDELDTLKTERESERGRVAWLI